MGTVMKVVLGVILANLLMIPLVLGMSAWMGSDEAEEEGVKTAQVENAQPAAAPVDLTDPAALTAYRNENDRLIGALDRDLDHIIGADRKSFVVERQASGSVCDIELVAQTPDESLVRYAPFPILAIVGMDSAISDGAGPMDSNLLRIMIDQRKTVNPDVPTVMISMPLEAEASKRLSQQPYFDMPHESAAERDRTKERLAELLERCRNIAKAEAQI